MTDDIPEVVDPTTGELVPYVPAIPPVTLFRSVEPAEILAHATEVANTLEPVIRERQLYKTINGRDHVFVEAWTLLGTILGVYPNLDGEVELVEIDGVKGWKATVKAVTRDGSVVGRAAAFCMSDEPNWRGRPLYALVSMAQTRATSKAMRQPLGFVIQLAGFAPTPAEEMPAEASQLSQGTIERVNMTMATTTGDLVTPKQIPMIKRLIIKVNEQGRISEEKMREAMKDSYGTRDEEALTKAQASDLITRLKKAAGEE